MKQADFEKLIDRAAELSTMPLDRLRSLSPDAEGDSQWQGIVAAKCRERHGAGRDEIRTTHIVEILKEEFGDLVEKEE